MSVADKVIAALAEAFDGGTRPSDWAAVLRRRLRTCQLCGMRTPQQAERPLHHIGCGIGVPQSGEQIAHDSHDPAENTGNPR